MGLPWRKNRPVILGNRAVANQNRDIFQQLAAESREDPSKFAIKYVSHAQGVIALEGKRYLGRFHIGLNALPADFDEVTKKAFLVSDVLMLTQDREGPVTELHETGGAPPFLMQGGAGLPSKRWLWGFQCLDTEALGRWLMGAEPLLSHGLVWYHPQLVKANISSGSLAVPLGEVGTPVHYDVVVRNGRAVEASGANPIASSVARILFTMKIPYIEGVSLEAFSKLTVEEFNSHKLFKTWLRKRILDLDDALEDTQSQRKIAAIEEELRHEVAHVQAQMRKATNDKALATTGAATCVTTVALFAVTQPAMLSLVTALGINAAGLWNFLTTFAEGGRRKAKAQNGQWFYMWALMKDSERL
ncbi:hypothetical protein [Streptomyces sp. NPDC059455]|uniref:hypothetical protein n=1 Tax=Streptomyces sp. NPDC059455 TaxID=3346837 RepID=UPI0036C120B9